jgi:hypothetical protein
MCPVELHGLLVALGIEPVEEDARTAPQRRPAALEWRPGEAAARTEVKPADLRLVFLTDAAGDRQILARAEVVLDVEAGLQGRDADERVADVAGERRRQPGVERVEAGEREGAGRIPPDIGAELAGLDQESRPQRMPANRDVEIVGDVGLVDGAAAANLRAARVERVQHLDGGREAGGRVRRFLRSELKAKVVEQGLANRAGRREAEQIVGARLVVAALRQIEITDAEIVRKRVVALRFAPEDLRR